MTALWDVVYQWPSRSAISESSESHWVFLSMITLFLAGLASVVVGPLLALFVADRATTDVASTVPASAGMFVASSNDNAAIAAQRAA